MNPYFKDMMEYLKEFNEKEKLFKVFQIHTNGNLMDEEKALTILETTKAFEFSKVFFSVDATTPEKYKAIRRGGKLETVRKVIIDFLKKKEKYGNVKAIIQFIVMDINKHQAWDFRKEWEDVLKELKHEYEILTYKEKHKINDWSNKDVIFFEFWQNDNPDKSSALFDEVEL